MRRKTFAKQFAARLKAARQAQGLTLQEVAHRVGMSNPQDVSQIESGHCIPSTWTAARLARALGISLEVLLPREFRHRPPPPHVILTEVACSSLACCEGNDTLLDGYLPSLTDAGCNVW